MVDVCVAEVLVGAPYHKLSYTLIYMEHIYSTTESLLVVAIHLSGHRADTGRLIPLQYEILA